jgi:hypothetical protein
MLATSCRGFDAGAAFETPTFAFRVAAIVFSPGKGTNGEPFNISPRLPVLLSISPLFPAAATSSSMTFANAEAPPFIPPDKLRSMFGLAGVPSVSMGASLTLRRPMIGPAVPLFSTATKLLLAFDNGLELELLLPSEFGERPRDGVVSCSALFSNIASRFRTPLLARSPMTAVSHRD